MEQILRSLSLSQKVDAANGFISQLYLKRLMNFGFLRCRHQCRLYQLRLFSWESSCTGRCTDKPSLYEPLIALLAPVANGLVNPNEYDQGKATQDWIEFSRKPH